ncbi:MAG: SAM-dependent methyltransferase [Acidimicrobiales bacterium]
MTASPLGAGSVEGDGSWPPSSGGSLPFEAFMDAALYDPRYGFYGSRAGSPGRRGDFLTAVEVGPLFGAVVARYLDQCWARLGQPNPFLVVDAGAGPGTLARTIRAAAPRCGPALALQLVERSQPARSAHPPGVVSVASLAEVPSAHVIVANELLDNLAIGLYEWHAGGWWEVWVGPDGPQRRSAPPPVPGRPHPPAALDALVPVPLRVDGLRLPWAQQAADWISHALAKLEPGGQLVVLDYGADTVTLATRADNGWLRTYQGHQRGTAPWVDPGIQDITAEVPFDQLPVPHRRSTQAEWLQRWGLEALVSEGRQQWQTRAGIGDLAALMGRSRIREAEALTQPGGLGDFVVCEWQA